MKKLLLAFLLLFVVAFAFVACGGSSIVGTWEAVSIQFEFDGEMETEYLDPGEFVMVFSDDGSGEIRDADISVRLEWSTDGDQLTVTAFGESDSSTFNVSGSTLTITEEGSFGTEILTLRRVD